MADGKERHNIWHQIQPEPVKMTGWADLELCGCEKNSEVDEDEKIAKIISMPDDMSRMDRTGTLCAKCFQVTMSE